MDHIKQMILALCLYSRNHMNGDDDNYGYSPNRDKPGETLDFGDYPSSPERSSRSHLTSAKSIDVIREDDEDEDDDESDDVPLDIGKH